MKITKRLLKKLGACQKSVDWFAERFDLEKGVDAKILAKEAMNGGRFSDCNWLATMLMTHEQRTKYAIYAAEKVIKIFEDKYPNDKQPRQAIQAAKNYLKNPSKDAAYAANAAANAAYAAADAADAANAAANAAYAAADAANAAYAARKKMQKQCINYALELLEL